jgi:hypothetical protein
MKDAGFIILHRSLLEWEWYNDINTTRLFIHCLLKANYKTKQWRGITIERGTFLTSTKTLAKETGLTIRQIRTSLGKLITTGEVTIKSTTKNSTITVNNYDTYQASDKQNNTQTTSKETKKRQTNDKPATTTNKSNKENKETIVKEENTPKVKYADRVEMKEVEYQKLVKRFTKETTDRYIEKVDLYLGTTNKKYKDHYLTVIKWITGDMEKNPQAKWLQELKQEQAKADEWKHETKRDEKELKDLFEKL